MFLPPVSYSQYLQLSYIQKTFSKVLAVNFEEMGIFHNLKENMTDFERISEMKRVNYLLGNDEVAMKIFVDKFQKFYKGEVSTDWSSNKTIQSKEKINGPQILARDILNSQNNK
jgi:hypothetical protein